MSNSIKSIIDNINAKNKMKYVTENSEEIEESSGESDQFCVYLLENNNCSDGCSCANISIEQQCPFSANDTYTECCCYVSSDDEGMDDEDSPDV